MTEETNGHTVPPMESEKAAASAVTPQPAAPVAPVQTPPARVSRYASMTKEQTASGAGWAAGSITIPSSNNSMVNGPVITSLDEKKRYVRRGFIAKGSHKVVYHCFDEEEGIEVAWNEIDTTSIIDLSKVLREVQLLQSLNHPHIIRCHASWIDEDRRALVFITELMTSGTLSDFISQQSSGSLKTHVMVKYSRQILSGLAYLARQNVIHRDLKSNNIFINGHKGEVKIGDLGLSIASRAANSVLGTPEYMAPEIYEENYTNAVDIWSFGMCMLQMVSGVHPYQECQNVGQIFRKVTNGILPESKDAVTDPVVKEVIFKCLQVDPAKRPTAEELLNHPLFREKEEVEAEPQPTPSTNAVAPPSVTASPTAADLQGVDTVQSEGPSQSREGSEEESLFTNVLDWIKSGPLKCQPAAAQLAIEQGWLDLRTHSEWRDWFNAKLMKESKRDHNGAARKEPGQPSQPTQKGPSGSPAVTAINTNPSGTSSAPFTFASAPVGQQQLPSPSAAQSREHQQHQTLINLTNLTVGASSGAGATSNPVRAKAFPVEPRVGPMTGLGESPETVYSSAAPSPTHSDAATHSISVHVDDLFTTSSSIHSNPSGAGSAYGGKPPLAERPVVPRSQPTQQQPLQQQQTQTQTQTVPSQNSTLNPIVPTTTVVPAEPVDKKKAAAATEQKLLAQMFGATAKPLSDPELNGSSPIPRRKSFDHREDHNTISSLDSHVDPQTY